MGNAVKFVAGLTVLDAKSVRYPPDSPCSTTDRPAAPADAGTKTEKYVKPEGLAVPAVGVPSDTGDSSDDEPTMVKTAEEAGYSDETEIVKAQSEPAPQPPPADASSVSVGEPRPPTVSAAGAVAPGLEGGVTMPMAEPARDVKVS